MRDGLLAEYLFAGDAADSSGGGRHGTVHGAALITDRFGRADHAYHFDGVDDYIQVAPPPPLHDTAVTVSTWACCDPRKFGWWTNCIVAQDDGYDPDQSRRVFQMSMYDGHFVWHRMIGARDPTSREPVHAGHWYHLVGVHDHGQNRLYVDGILQDTVAHRLWVHPTQPLHIGRKGSAEPFFFFRGAIDDVRIYDRPLISAEILELFHEGGWQSR